MSKYEAYCQISKEAAAQCNAARWVASLAYDQAMEPIRKAMHAASSADFPSLTAAMAKLDRKRDAALAKAERQYALVMKQAWQEHIIGDMVQERQLALW